MICLPKDPTATRSMLVFKLFLQLVFLLSLVTQVVYTFLTVRYFRGKIVPESTRSQVQILRTHGHFFLLSGIWSTVVLMIGSWGILSELVGVIISFVFMSSAGIVFQLMGSFASDDVGVAKLKMLGALIDPVLIFLSLIYAHLVRQNINTLFSLPIYRKSIVESRRSSFSEVISTSDVSEEPVNQLTNHRDYVRKHRQSSVTPHFLDPNHSSNGNKPHFTSPHFHHHTQVIPSFLNDNIFFTRNPAFDNYK